MGDNIRLNLLILQDVRMYITPYFTLIYLMNHINKVAIFIFVLLSPFMASAETSDNDGSDNNRFTIMGLGDSITEGGETFCSYLYPLWEKLFSAGYDFEFIGPRESRCRIGSISHCGFSGHTAEFLDEHIDSLYREYPADIVLLHAGHNHFAEDKPVDSIVRAYRSIINKIIAINPSVKILAAKVIPSGKLPKYSYISELNIEIGKLVDSLNLPNVVLVNQASGFDWQTNTISDKVHPNKSGAEKMASVWFDALKKILPAQHPFAPKVVAYKHLEQGDSLNLHIFMPKMTDGQNEKRRPAILYFFGGGWSVGSPLQFYRECEYYSSKGFVAVSADYRIKYLHGSTPYDSFEDAKDAVRYLRSRASELGIDPNRIVVAGASAGGELAAALGTVGGRSDSDYKPNLMVLHYPVVDNSPDGYGYNLFGENYEKISPFHNVTENTPPALFMVGTEDSIVTQRMVTKFCDKMRRCGVDCELHWFEKSGHPIFYYRKPLTDSYYKMLELTDDFLHRYKYLE